jgi:predicted nucleic acid-binding protein
MNIYIESSSVLAWLLGESDAEEIRFVIDKAEIVATSVLTLMEAERGLIRAEKAGLLRSADRHKLKGLLMKSADDWARMEITEEVQSKAKEPFFVEPIRTLDAIHLATILEFTEIIPELEVLSRDQRILVNLEPLGLKAVEL